MPRKPKQQDEVPITDPHAFDPTPIEEALPPVPEKLEVQPEPEAPRRPQGLTPRYVPLERGRAAYHKLWKTVRLVDPDSLGEAPFLALPINGDPTRRRIRNFAPEVAAELLSVNLDNGMPPTIRLATDAEVEQYHREMEARAVRGQARIADRVAKARTAAQNAIDALQ